MRYSTALLLLAAFLPLAGAPNVKVDCKSRCGTDYELCLKRSNSKAARKTCSAARKSCKLNCRGR